MRFQHPYRWLSANGQQRAFIVLLVLTLVLITSLQLLGAPLQTEVAPAGIVSFEFAGELTVAHEIVASWGPRGQIYAGLNLGLDYLFLVAYGGSISLGCVLVARNLSRRMATLSASGRLLSWALIIAALLDSLENYALIQLLLGSNQALWPMVAFWCALPKFLIVAAGLLYIVAGTAVVLLSGLRANVARQADSR